MLPKRYNKKLNYSYVLGVYPTLELLINLPAIVEVVFIKTNSRSNEGVKEIIEICKRKNIPVHENDRLILKLGRKGNIYAIGLFNKFEKPIERNKNHIVLVNPSDAGNLGTIIRTMVGFGVENLAIINPAVDIFFPEVIRASMGSIFKIRFQYFNSFEEYRNSFKENSIYPFMTDADNLINTIKFKSPWSFIFGSESDGLPLEYKRVGKSVRIPQSKGIDSLNLAVSVGIALFASECC